MSKKIPFSFVEVLPNNFKTLSKSKNPALETKDVLQNQLATYNWEPMFLTSGLIDAIYQKGLITYEMWLSLENFIDEFKIDKIIGNNLTTPELYKTFQEFKGTFKDVDIYSRLTGYEVEVVEANKSSLLDLTPANIGDPASDCCLDVTIYADLLDFMKKYLNWDPKPLPNHDTGFDLIAILQENDKKHQDYLNSEEGESVFDVFTILTNLLINRLYLAVIILNITIRYRLVEEYPVEWFPEDQKADNTREDGGGLYITINSFFEESVWDEYRFINAETTPPSQWKFDNVNQTILYNNRQGLFDEFQLKINEKIKYFNPTSDYEFNNEYADFDFEN